MLRETLITLLSDHFFKDSGFDEDLKGFLAKIDSEGLELAETGDVKLLVALQDAGVDNWEGYSYAQELLEE